MSNEEIQRVKASTEIKNIMDILDRDGALIVTHILDQDDIAALTFDIEVLFKHSVFCDGLFFGKKTKRIHALVTKSAVSRKMVMHPIILRVMNEILSPYCEKIQINLTQGIQIWPGETAQILHRDDSMFPTNNRACEFMANVMWACSRFTARNGGTVLALGSHKWQDKSRRPTDKELIQADMEPGDALIYLGSIIHAGGANHSSAPRTGIVIGYSLGWLRQYENQYLSVPPELARNYAPALQELLGYTVYSTDHTDESYTLNNEPNMLYDNGNSEGFI